MLIFEDTSHTLENGEMAVVLLINAVIEKFWWSYWKIHRWSNIIHNAMVEERESNIPLCICNKIYFNSGSRKDHLPDDVIYFVQNIFYFFVYYYIQPGHYVRERCGRDETMMSSFLCMDVGIFFFFYVEQIAPFVPAFCDAYMWNPPFLDRIV